MAPFAAGGPGTEKTMMDPAADIPGRTVALVDAFVDYFADILRLQALRLEGDARAVVKRAAVFLAAGAVGLAGFVFLSIAAADWLASLLESRAAGFAAVGGVYMISSAVAMTVSRGRR